MYAGQAESGRAVVRRLAFLGIIGMLILAFSLTFNVTAQPTPVRVQNNFISWVGSSTAEIYTVDTFINVGALTYQLPVGAFEPVVLREPIDVQMPGTCQILAGTQVICNGNFARLELRYRYNANSTNGIYTIAAGGADSVVRNFSIQVSYPRSFAFLDANVPPQSNENNMLLWSDTTSSMFVTMRFISNSDVPVPQVYFPLIVR